MDRTVSDRPRDRSRSVERGGRFRISRDEGRARLLEAMIMLSALMVLALALGFAVGLPLALMLNDICDRLEC